MATGEPGVGADSMSDANMLVVVVDASGSMREHGKAMIARQLVAHLDAEHRSPEGPWQLGSLVVLRWGTETAVVDLSPGEDLPVMVCGGRAQGSALVAALSALVDGATTLRALLISDGHLDPADVRAFTTWQRRNSRVSVRTIAVGPDAATAALAKMAERGGAFLPEEIDQALTTWTLPRESTLPVSVAELFPSASGARP